MARRGEDIQGRAAGGGCSDTLNCLLVYNGVSLLRQWQVRLVCPATDITKRKMTMLHVVIEIYFGLYLIFTRQVNKPNVQISEHEAMITGISTRIKIP